MQHPFFDGTMWENLHSEQHPPDLHLPLFTYNEGLSGVPAAPRLPDPSSTASSTPFAFSAFFQPSEEGSTALIRTTTTSSSILREEAESFFIGFSWGPTDDAFPNTTPPPPPQRVVPVPQTPLEVELKTPMRRIGGTTTASTTLRRTRTAPRRAVSDREAMRQLVDCIGLSARKKVLESGRTPRITTTTTAKSLRFALNFTNGDSALALALAATSDEEEESDGADAPPSPSPSPGPRPASAMSRRSVTPTATVLLLQPPPLPLEGDEDELEVLEERYRALMGEIASIEGKVGAMRRRTR
jgi:hypothetical protein